MSRVRRAGSEHIVGDLGRGVPHVEPPLDVTRRRVVRRMSGQLNPTGVAHPAEHRPVVDGKVEQCPGQGGDQSTVSDEDDGPVGIVDTPFVVSLNQFR